MEQYGVMGSLHHHQIKICDRFGFTGQVRLLLERTGLTRKIGAGNLFPTLAAAVAASERNNCGSPDAAQDGGPA